MVNTIYPVDATAGAPSYSGRMLRQTAAVAFAGATAARPLGARSGVRPGTSTATVQATSTTWTVYPHAGLLDFEAAAESGPTPYSIDAAVTGAVRAADAFARVDLVWVRQDIPIEDGAAAPAVVPGYTYGTVASTPPATPARCMVLAWINVPASGGGSPTVTWKAPTAVAAGAPIPVYSQAERDALTVYSGMQVIRVDVSGSPTETYNGSAWDMTRKPNIVQRSGTGATPAAGTFPIIEAFVVADTTNGSGVITVTFPSAFTVQPIVTATTVQGTSVAAVVNSNAITTTTVQLAFPGVLSTAVRVHIVAIGW